MKFEIKSNTTSSVLFSVETESMKLCVEAAVKSRANLSRANLSGANLSRANLSWADLSGADLSGANLSRAILSWADLSRAILSGANLSGANLSRTDLSRTDLSEANLSGANLSRANLSWADLSGANLFGAILSGADLSNLSALQKAIFQILPQEGAFIGWKKLNDGIIAKLVIPHDAKRMNALGSRKCRAERVLVQEMFANGETFTGIGIGTYGNKTEYITGKETLPDAYNENIAVECSHGIHFFLTREEAENYN